MEHDHDAIDAYLAGQGSDDVRTPDGSLAEPVIEPQETSPAEEAPPSEAETQPGDEKWQKLAGDRANEIGSLRQALRETGEAGQAKLQELYGQDPREARQERVSQGPAPRGNTPDEQLFHQYWQASDPENYETSVDDPYETARARTAFNMARMALGAVLPMVQDISGQVAVDREVSMFAEHGIRPESVLAVKQNPTLAGLWTRATFEERLELLKTAGATGESPATEGASSQPTLIPGQHIESAGGSQSRPATSTPGNDRMDKVQDLIDAGKTDDPLVQDAIDDMLNESIRHVRGAVINPRLERGRRRR